MALLTIERQQQVYYEYLPGSTHDTTVVLSHGFGMAGRVWDNTVARLQDAGYGVLSYDHRNCGQSSKDFTDVSIDSLGSDLVAICDVLSLSKVVLNGWSLGGAIVVDAAAKLGSKVVGLVLTGGATPRYTQASGFPHGGQASDVEATVAALRADRVNFLKGLYYEGVFAAPVTDDVKHWCWQIALQASSGADASLGALAQVDQREIMGRLQMPALVVVGAEDGVVPADIGAFAANLLPRGQLVNMPGCGHAPFLEDMDAYHGALFTFLSETLDG